MRTADKTDCLLPRGHRLLSSTFCSLTHMVGETLSQSHCHNSLTEKRERRGERGCSTEESYDYTLATPPSTLSEWPRGPSHSRSPTLVGDNRSQARIHTRKLKFRNRWLISFPSKSLQTIISGQAKAEPYPISSPSNGGESAPERGH